MKTAVIISSSIAIIIALFLSRPDNDADLKETLPKQPLYFNKVIQQDIQPIVYITGKLQPTRSVRIHFQVGGQIKERHIEAGQYVTADSLLLAIQDGDFVDAVAESRALLAIQQKVIERESMLLNLLAKEITLQQQEIVRLAELGKGSLASQSNYEQALQVLYRQQAEQTRLQHNYDSAKARLLLEQARLNTALRNLERTQLSAPFAGTINDVYVDVGDYVSPGQAAVELVQIDQLDLSLEVTSTIAQNLALGQTLTVTLNNDARQGEIIALAAEPNAETNTHALKIRLLSTGLHAGQLAVAALPGKLYQNAHVVPTSAILYEEGQAYVFALVNNKLYRRPITRIARYQDLQVIAGVAADTKIVSNNVTSLADGQIVSEH